MVIWCHHDNLKNTCMSSQFETFHTFSPWMSKIFIQPSPQLYAQCYFICLFVCLFWKRVREHVGEWQGAQSHDHEIMTWTKIKCRKLNQLSHPGAPCPVVLQIFSGQAFLIFFNRNMQMNWCFQFPMTTGYKVLIKFSWVIITIVSSIHWSNQTAYITNFDGYLT